MALLGENLEVGFNMTDISEAEVSAAQFYDEPRAIGGQVPSGLEPSQALPLFADLSWYAYAELSGIDMFGGTGLIRLQHSFVGESLNQLTDSATAPQMVQGDYDITDLVVSFELDKWQAQARFSNLGDERGISYEDSSDFDQFWGRNSSTVIRPSSFSFSLRRFF